MITKWKYSKIRAFTVVELVVVMSIIALIVGIIIPNLEKARSRSRDSKRVSDLAQLQVALTRYHDQCHDNYPANLLLGENVGCPSGITLGTFIASIPTPPVSSLGQTQYEYTNNNNFYILSTVFENDNSEILENSPRSTSIVDQSHQCYESSPVYQLDLSHHYCITEH